MSQQALDGSLPALLKNADNLPSLPAVAVEVLRLTRNEETTIEELAEAIERDPALSAKLLKLSNAAMFNPGHRTVTSMNQAAMTLGLKTVKLMSLSFSLVSSLPESKSGGAYDFQKFWQRSLCAAVAGRSLGKVAKSRVADEAFTCGLFSLLGQVVLVQALMDQYGPVLDAAGDELPSAALERELLGFDNSNVAMALLREWELPPELYLAVGHLNQPDAVPTECEEADRSLIVEIARLAHAADLCARVICDEAKGLALRELIDLCQSHYGLDSPAVDQLLVGLQSDVVETADMMSIDLPSQDAYSEIVDQARMQIVQISLDTTMNLQQAERRAHTLEAENKALQTRANTDKLTGLGNRAFFDSVLEERLAQRIDGDAPLCLGLLMIDVDHFKKFNDSYGHQVGDEVLELVGKALEKYTRDTDIPARYGGEEFVVLAPETTLDGLRVLAERLRFRIAQQELEHEDEKLSVTVSIGGACIENVTSTKIGKPLVQIADHYLYEAKRRGRNRCEFYPELELPSAGPPKA